ncbi:MAG TPA: DUF2066 domain-containing protein [Stellaceae bacterium]|nr:DUF2066 domain-containing protein [Stellaceae bacterium]
MTDASGEGMTVAARTAKRHLRAALAAICLALAAAPANAQTASTQADVYTVANVPVDATAASADAARETARLQGEHQAYAILLGRLTRASDASRLPPANDATLNDLIQGFEVANERHSTVRYLANYTFHFRPDAVRQLLRGAGVSFAETLSKPLVVLPVLDSGGSTSLWEDPNPWRAAWNERNAPAGLVPLVMPFGGAEDIAAIDAKTAVAADNGALTAISQRYGGADVLIAHATVANGGTANESVAVATARYSPGSAATPQTWNQTYKLGAGEDEGALMARAVAGTVAQVEDAWKAANILDVSQVATLTASVPIAGLQDWVAVSQRLRAIPAVQKTDLMAIDRQHAEITIHYVGDLTQLRLALAQNNLDLNGDASNYVLAPHGAGTLH